jgi:hypothetical protein
LHYDKVYGILLKGGCLVKKSLLPIALLIALIVLFASGSIALYTKTEVLNGQISTSLFILNGNEKTTSYQFGLSGLTLMPGEGEKELYRFDVSNGQGTSTVSDYDLLVTISSAGMADAIQAMTGLTFYLYDVTSESATPIATVTSGELDSGGITFPSTVKTTVEYKLTAEWTDTGDSQSQTSVASSDDSFPIMITITAENGT